MAWSIAIRGMAAILVLPLAGCSFFGIDTRPDIEYATVTERRAVKEPMYQRQIPGTNLVKRWPARHGLAYGYAPWETKKDAVMVSQDASGGGATATANAAANGAASGPSNRSPSARAQAKSPGSQANLAANWAPRHEAEPITPKSHLRPPSKTPVAATDHHARSSAVGLIQPRSIAPGSAASHVEGTAADEEAAPPPDNRSSNLPNVYDPSDQQPTPDDEPTM
jgi:hypothetical protein